MALEGLRRLGGILIPLMLSKSLQSPFTLKSVILMSFKDAIIGWIFKNVKIKREALVSIVNDFDLDKDGYISLSEFVKGLNEWRRWAE